MSDAIAALHLLGSAVPAAHALDPRLILLGGGLGLLGTEAVGLFLPEMSPSGLLFGVTVRTEQQTSKEGRRLKRLFRLIVLAASIPALATLWASAIWSSVLLLQFAFVFPCAFAYLAFIVCRAKARPFGSAPSLVREAPLAGTRDGLPGGALHLIPGLLAAATFVHLAIHWQDLPAPFPVKYDLAGHPLAWAHKSLATVFGGPFICSLAWILVIPLALSLLHSSRRGAQNSLLSRQRRLMAGVYAGVADVAALLGASMAINPFLSSYESRLLAPLVIGVFLIAILVLTIALVRFYRTGARVGEGAAGGDGTPDTAWKAGMFYCNRDDPALWVPARFGMGYTLNFGNRWAWLILAATLVVAVLSITAAALSGG